MGVNGTVLGRSIGRTVACVAKGSSVDVCYSQIVLDIIKVFDYNRLTL